MPGANRLVPVSQTDLAASPPDAFPVPVDISSLRKLTRAYRRIAAQVATEKRDGGKAQPSERGERSDSVANAHREAAARGAEEDRVHLSTDGDSMSGERNP